MRIVASMVVRNERGRYLDLVLAHLLTFCAEVRVLDDRSDDGTYELCEETAGVEVERTTTAAWIADESAARQALLDWTMEASPDYVLGVDADEFVGEPQRVLAAAEREEPVASLSMIEVWNASPWGLDIRSDGQWGPRACPVLWRAPKRMRGGLWRIPRRKLACGREPLAVRRSHATPTGASLLHFGWTRLSEREERAERYFAADRGRYHASAHLQSILWPKERVELVYESWPAGLKDLIEPLAERANVA